MSETNQSAGGPAVSDAQARETVLRCYQVIVPKDDPSQALELDSLKVLDLSIRLSEELGLDFDTVLETVLSSTTVDDLVAAMERLSA